MPGYVYTILIIVAGVVTLISIIRMVSLGVQKKILKEINSRYAGRKIHGMTSSSSFFGLTSKGAGQVRGQGALVMAEDELFFLLGVPRNEITIPYKKITGLELKKSHLGKSIGRDLLHVSFETEYGYDSAAWHVREPRQWLEALEKLRKA